MKPVVDETGVDETGTHHYRYTYTKLRILILWSLFWMLEGLKKYKEDLLDVPSYGEPLGEAIL